MRRRRRSRTPEAFAWTPVASMAMALNNVSWTQEATLVDGVILGTGVGIFDQNKGAVVRKLLIQIGAYVLTATVSTIYRLLVSVYIKDRDDTSVYNVNGASPFATDGDEDIIWQDHRDLLSPAAGAGPTSYVTPDRPWSIQATVNRTITPESKLMINFGAFKMGGGSAWGGLTLTDQVSINGSARIGLVSRRYLF